MSFIDFAARARIANKLQSQNGAKKVIRVLIVSSVLYPSVEPFLEALQTADPLRFPFADYLKHSNFLHQGLAVPLPAYARAPGFTWNLEFLLRDEHKTEPCIMDPTSASSVLSVRERVRKIGKLDPR
jgi:hypothetical protein